MPSRMAFGNARFWLSMFHPCAPRTYKPCSVLTLQPPIGALARATPGVLNAIAAIRLTNAQVKSKEPVILLNTFVCITIIPFLILAICDFSLRENQFWPFADVQNGNQPEVSRKAGCRRRDHGSGRY